LAHKAEEDGGEGSPKPLLIIEILIKKEQASSETKLQQLEMGSRAPPHKKRWMEKD